MMTIEEKEIRHDALLEIRQKISGCFGTADGIFAGHPFDEKRAKELMKYSLNNKITLREVIEISLGYLYGRGYHGEHIKQQIEKVSAMFGKKLQ